MYTLEKLLADVLRDRGSLRKDGGGKEDYMQVWDVFNRYITAVMGKQLTLSYSTFCKIGWKVEEQGKKVKLRPHFQMTDMFAQAHDLDTKLNPSVPDKHLCAMEEFNFSKAAIRYSQNLTKDLIFLGMRSIIHLLGQAMSSGQQVSIDFEVGKLTCSERVARFAFVADLYLKEGLEVPAGSLQDAEYRPSATFAPPSKDALSLSLQGTGRLGGEQVRAIAHGGWEDSGCPAASSGKALPQEQSVEPRGSNATARPYDVQSTVSSRLERVSQEALDRHIGEIGMAASAAMADRAQWEAHLTRIEEEEQKDQAWRRALARDYSEQLRDQMRQVDEKRTSGREHSVAQASMHDFPNFRECPEVSASEYIRERRSRLKEDLDQQVDTKLYLQKCAKQREREQEAANLQANQKEIALLKLEAAVRKENERLTLHRAWENDKKLHSVRKAIEEHHKSPVKNVNLSDLVNSLGANSLDSGGPSRSLGPPLGSVLSPRSPRNAEELSQASSRPVTGSVRRMPIGAAASLALHKEKLGAALRR